MINSIVWLGAGLSAAAAVILYRCFKDRGKDIPAVFFYLYFVLPFLAGGFHSHVSFVTSWVLFFQLLRLYRENKSLSFVLNINSLSVLMLVAAYAVAPLWAASRGMAMYGLLRYLPLLLYILLLMQYPARIHRDFLALIPLSGAFMTVISCALLLFPEAKATVTVYARLSGFLQYPNTYAVFLLAGLILQNLGSTLRKEDYLIDAVLILGIALSGSRTCFVLLFFTLAGIVVLHHKLRQLLVFGGFLAGSLLLVLIASRVKILHEVDRFFKLDFSDSSFLLRFLFYKDALKIIADHPFGTGFLGYIALEGLYQTGCYTVTFVHNGLLQILLDVGWIPGLFMAGVFLKGLCSPKTAPGSRLILFILLGHCMLDFDLQFFLIWVLLLSTLDFETGKRCTLPVGKNIVPGICIAVLLWCSLLGIGDYFYSTGRYETCMKLVPWHTDAMTKQLRKTDTPEQADVLADRILEWNPTSGAAYSAKAGAAFASGRILDMIGYKKQAISLSRFAVHEYNDYFKKLYTAMQTYVRNGDTESAAYCANRLLEIPGMLDAAAAITDPLDTETIEKNILQLPEAYREVLAIISQ